MEARDLHPENAPSSMVVTVSGISIEGSPLAALECLLADGRDGVGEADRFQRDAVGEGAGADGGDRFRYDDALEALAAFERVLPYLGQSGVEVYGLQGVATRERLRLHGLQGRREPYGFQGPAALERTLLDYADRVGDLDGLQVLAALERPFPNGYDGFRQDYGRQGARSREGSVVYPGDRVRVYHVGYGDGALVAFVRAHVCEPVLDAELESALLASAGADGLFYFVEQHGI